MTEIENYLAPRDLESALKALADSDVTVFCGGTDLNPQTDAGQVEYTPILMNIRRIEGLAGISLTGKRIRIGALTTVTEVMENQLIIESAPVLVETADQFASDQIRNAASIGGNLCNASPAGDMIIPLLLLDASVELASWDDGTVRTRMVALDEFFTGPGKTVKRDDELLTAVFFAQPAVGFVARFRKSGPRPALEIATVSVGIGGRLEDGVLNNVRVAMGAVAPTPLRVHGVEDALEGNALDGNTIQAATEKAVADTVPIDDVRASAWYRSHLVSVFTEEVLASLTKGQVSED